MNDDWIEKKIAATMQNTHTHKHRAHAGVAFNIHI